MDDRYTAAALQIVVAVAVAVVVVVGKKDLADRETPDTSDSSSWDMSEETDSKTVVVQESAVPYIVAGETVAGGSLGIG